jgi:hypothetical protein
MSTKIKYLLFLLLFVYNRANAQDKPSMYDKCLGIKGGYYFGNYHGFELGIGYYKAQYFGPHGPELFKPTIYGVNVSTELLPAKPNIIYGPKVSAECGGFYFTMYRLSLIDYLYNQQSSVKVCPEAGLSLYGFVALTCGYNIALNNANLVLNNGARISLQFTLPLISLEHKK